MRDTINKYILLTTNACKQNIWLIIILLFFGLIYSSVSLVNHYNFRTFGFDLGIYNNVIYDYSKLQVNDNKVMHVDFNNILSDHLSLYHFFYAPFRYIFGSWTLLLFQIISMLFGAIGIYKLIYYLTSNILHSNLAAFHFLSMWGIFSALSFDYHDNVVATMFVPWIVLSVIQKRTKESLIWTFIFLISKENMALWSVFIFVGLFFWKIKDPQIRKLTFIGGIISFIYFILAVKVIMPAFANPGKSYSHISRYAVLGNSMTEYVETIFLKPKVVFSLLFENHSGNPYFNGIKTELHYVVLLSGGIALLYKPQFLIMLIPIYLQKLFNNDMQKWGVNAHYSVEYAPILTIALFVWINDSVKKIQYKNILLIIGSILCLAVNYAVIDKRNSQWYDASTLRFWDKSHYVRNFNVEEVHKQLEQIPEDASVCAQNMLVPHLALREKIYTFPYIRDAEYIAVLPIVKHPYPLSHKGYKDKIDQLRNGNKFEVLVDNGEFILFRKIMSETEE